MYDLTNFLLSDVVSIPLASQSISGLLSNTDKTKLDSIDNNAQVNPTIATSEDVDNLTETAPRLFSPAQINNAIASRIETVTPQEMSANAAITSRVVHLLGSTTAATLPVTGLPTTVDVLNTLAADVNLSGNVIGYPGGYYIEPKGYVRLGKRSSSDWSVLETYQPPVQVISTDNAVVTSPLCLVGGAATTVYLPSGTKRALTRARIKNTLGTAVTIQASARDWNVRGVTIPLYSNAYAVMRAISVADGQKFVLSVCVKPSSSATTETQIFRTGVESTANYVAVGITASNTMLNVSIKTSNTTHTDVSFAITAGVAQHWLISVDLSVPRVQFCLNGILQSATSTKIPGNTSTNIPWSATTDMSLLAFYSSSVRTFVGSMAQYWMDIGTAYDLTNGPNIAKFFANGEPADLGATGASPTGSTPTIFLNRAGTPFFLNPSDGGAAFSIDSHVAPTIPPSGTFPMAAAITGNPSGYTLAAGQTVEMVQSSLGVWDIL